MKLLILIAYIMCNMYRYELKAPDFTGETASSSTAKKKVVIYNESGESQFKHLLFRI